ncbi:cysteine-rich tail protein 1 [Colius striatus]|uniref:cysteine-rich tail protein 1 n=1 Tax=Colius striatus TaxID=57412 RepID=UPI002B1DEC73|nr:cysteine-rich tail protein 1 [Colius striatus]
MDRGISVENPYASVSIPREQFQQSFITRYLKDEPTVIANPAAVPTYSEEKQADPTGSWNSSPISTERSWSRPYNPYASLRNGESANSFYTVTLDKPPKGQELGTDGRCSCCKCCPCFRKCCCVVS